LSPGAEMNGKIVSDNFAILVIIVPLI